MKKDKGKKKKWWEYWPEKDRKWWEKISKEIGIKRDGKLFIRLLLMSGGGLDLEKKELQRFGKKWKIPLIKKWDRRSMSSILEEEKGKYFKNLNTEQLTQFANELFRLELREAITELSDRDIVNYLFTHDNIFLDSFKLARVPYPEIRSIQKSLELWVRIWSDTDRKDVEDCWELIKREQKVLRNALSKAGLPKSKEFGLGKSMMEASFLQDVGLLYYHLIKKYSYPQIAKEVEMDEENIKKRIQRLKDKIKKNPRVSEFVLDNLQKGESLAHIHKEVWEKSTKEIIQEIRRKKLLREGDKIETYSLKGKQYVNEKDL